MDRQRQALDRLKIISLGSCKGNNINSFKESGQVDRLGVTSL